MQYNSGVAKEKATITTSTNYILHFMPFSIHANNLTMDARCTLAEGQSAEQFKRSS
jgi:hypothetical protein